jgi:rare lipoprotein A
MTAAHPELPFGTEVVVTRPDTGVEVTVVINDRGPFVKGRIIDLSKRAARELGMINRGVAPVMITSIQGS